MIEKLILLTGHTPNKAGEEPGELGALRKKLVWFLHKSRHYIPERLLTRFPTDGKYFSW